MSVAVSKDFGGQPFLELLRPPKGSTTRLAIFASYSADPVVLGGALLFLLGRGRSDGGGSKVDFADAVETLRGKVRFVLQRGRLHRGGTIPKITAVLDQFIEEMPYDEDSCSWHPKLALVCFEDSRKRPAWRLWLGSRNLTGSRDLDLGLMLDGSCTRVAGARAIPGIPELASALATHARLPGVNPVELAKELGSVRWAAPDGMQVDYLRLRESGAAAAQPFGLGETREIVILSPFLCDKFVSNLATSSSASSKRTLVTTLPALRKLRAPARECLKGFRLLTLSPPIPEGDAADSAWSGDDLQTDDSFDSSQHTGLHAKLFAAIKGKSAEVIAGSANATDRAWAGRNAEAIVRFTGDATFVEGIHAIVGAAHPVPQNVFDHMPEPEDADDAMTRLERERSRIAGWPLELERKGQRFILSAETSELVPTGMVLEVGLATAALHRWADAPAPIDFGEVILALQTDLVQFRLSIDDQTPSVGWMRRVEVSPPLALDRDSAAISRFLSVAGLQAWLRGMLSPDGGPDGGDDWAESGGQRRKSGSPSWISDGLALEDILSAWGRNDVSKLRKVDQMLQRYTATILAHDEYLSDRDKKDLEALGAIWAVARQVLLSDR